VWNAVTGGLMTDITVYPILRGEGEKAPPFEGSFPTEDGQSRDLGKGWLVMCVRFTYESTAHEKIAKLAIAEDKLRAMKQAH